MTGDLQLRRRRASYRASHRGTKEMDALVGRYAVAKLSQLNGEELHLFERLLTVADPTLQDWIFAGVDPGSEFADLIGDIRSFHGLSCTTGETTTGKTE